MQNPVSTTAPSVSIKTSQRGNGLSVDCHCSQEQVQSVYLEHYLCLSFWNHLMAQRTTERRNCTFGLLALDSNWNRPGKCTSFAPLCWYGHFGPTLPSFELFKGCTCQKNYREAVIFWFPWTVFGQSPGIVVIRSKIRKYVPILNWSAVFRAQLSQWLQPARGHRAFHSVSPVPSPSN